MEQKIREIAGRIKDLREILEISAAEMAQLTGVTEREYAEYEEGKRDFSFTFIFKCAHRFGVDVTDILKGTSPTLTSYAITRRGQGLPIVRRKGFSYRNFAPLFKNRLAEPFFVKAPYSEAEQDAPISMSSHAGQEINIILKGSLKIVIDGHTEILNEGDTVYYDSASPHGMIATGGTDCEFIAIVLNHSGKGAEYTQSILPGTAHEAPVRTQKGGAVYEKFVSCEMDENGVLSGIQFHHDESFNFAFDVVDALAEKCPDKTAIIHVDNDKNNKYFTFADISKSSSRAANYFRSLGIKKGDKVMLVLKRHHQFWTAIIGLHKLGAIVIPATHQLVEHDFVYRFKSAEVSAVICTADGDVTHQVELAQREYDGLKVRVIVNGTRDGWNSFDEEINAYSSRFPRTEDSACGTDDMIMFFTSGTTGYPKIAIHDCRYPLGHFITAKHWQNVNPDGVHFTISDTGWAKSLWGKLYGQWLCETAVFVYDFEKFDAHDILSMFKKYNITTFCAPPTMFRFFIKEDLSKYDLSSLEYAVVAGEALNPEVFNQFFKATGIKLMEGFGQTETTVSVCNLVGTQPRVGSMGRPVPLYDMDIVMPDGTPAAVGETGEVVIRLDKGFPCGLFKGYKDKANTDAVIYDNLYHTGDTAWRDEDGYYWYVGRIDDLIKSSGYRIGPFEIESVIMELPYVLECAITPVPDEIRGQIVKASIVLTKGTVGTDALKKEIQEYVKTHTAPYKYPRIVDFLEELPKTISGKIRRVELREKDTKKD